MTPRYCWLITHIINYQYNRLMCVKISHREHPELWSRFGNDGRRQVTVNGLFHEKFWHWIKKCKEKKEHLETTFLQKMGISVQLHERMQRTVKFLHLYNSSSLWNCNYCFLHIWFISVLFSVIIRLINNTERGIFYHC